MLGNGSNKGSEVRPYTGLYECQMGVDLWTLVFPISKHFTHDKLYFLNLCGNPFNLSLFSSKSDHPENLTPYKRSMTFSYFVLYLDNTTSYGYHVIYFFTPYNKRNNMTCIATKLKHFEFSNAWRGVSLSSLEGVCIILFTLYLWNFIISASQGIFLDKAHKNSRII